jgi:cell division protein FtsZ
MDKFGSDFELKWGVANDPSLGDKVKVTILATGFGLGDIDEALAERQHQKTAQDLQKEAEEQERKERELERMKHYYGTDGNNAPQKRRHNIFLFSASDLDNEDLILAVENTPTYGRTRQSLEALSHLVMGFQKAEDESPAQQAPKGGKPEQGTISFL